VQFIRLRRHEFGMRVAIGNAILHPVVVLIEARFLWSTTRRSEMRLRAAQAQMMLGLQQMQLVNAAAHRAVSRVVASAWDSLYTVPGGSGIPHTFRSKAEKETEELAMRSGLWRGADWV
jgi:hypothetical protein